LTHKKIIKKIRAVNVSPGLNKVLDMFEAPNGINEYKKEMKKKFANTDKKFFL